MPDFRNEFTADEEQAMRQRALGATAKSALRSLNARASKPSPATQDLPPEHPNYVPDYSRGLSFGYEAP